MDRFLKSEFFIESILEELTNNDYCLLESSYSLFFEDAKGDVPDKDYKEFIDLIEKSTFFAIMSPYRAANVALVGKEYAHQPYANIVTAAKEINEKNMKELTSLIDKREYSYIGNITGRYVEISGIVEEKSVCIFPGKKMGKITEKEFFDDVFKLAKDYKQEAILAHTTTDGFVLLNVSTEKPMKTQFIPGQKNAMKNLLADIVKERATNISTVGGKTISIKLVNVEDKSDPVNAESILKSQETTNQPLGYIKMSNEDFKTIQPILTKEKMEYSIPFLRGKYDPKTASWKQAYFLILPNITRENLIALVQKLKVREYFYRAGGNTPIELVKYNRNGNNIGSLTVQDIFKDVDLVKKQQQIKVVKEREGEVLDVNKAKNLVSKPESKYVAAVFADSSKIEQFLKDMHDLKHKEINQVNAYIIKPDSKTQEHTHHVLVLFEGLNPSIFHELSKNREEVLEYGYKEAGTATVRIFEKGKEGVKPVGKGISYITFRTGFNKMIAKTKPGEAKEFSIKQLSTN